MLPTKSSCFFHYKQNMLPTTNACFLLTEPAGDNPIVQEQEQEPNRRKDMTEPHPATPPHPCRQTPRRAPPAPPNSMANLNTKPRTSVRKRGRRRAAPARGRRVFTALTRATKRAASVLGVLRINEAGGERAGHRTENQRARGTKRRQGQTRPKPAPQARTTSFCMDVASPRTTFISYMEGVLFVLQQLFINTD